MKRKFILVLPSKQRLYKIAFSAGTGLSETLLGRRKRRTRTRKKLLDPSTEFKITILIVNLATKKWSVRKHSALLMRPGTGWVMRPNVIMPEIVDMMRPDTH